MSVLTSPDRTCAYLTIAEVAERLHCSEPTIRRRIRAGDLEAVKFGPGRNSAVRVPRVAISDWLREVQA